MLDCKKKSRKKNVKPVVENVPLYLGFGAIIRPWARIVNPKGLFVDDFAVIDDFSFILATARTHIGKFAHLSPFSLVSGGGEFQLGDFSEISYGAKIITGTDDIYGNYLFTPSVPIGLRNVKRSSVTIEELSIVGTNAIVYPGVRIGQGAIVCPGTIVKTNLLSWRVYEGIDCQCIGYRKGKKELIEKMEEAKRQMKCLVKKLKDISSQC